MTTNLVETTTTAPKTTAPGRFQVCLISPGWGSSGHYSPKVLENAAEDKVWSKGTHVFFDHPSESEMHDRPERSVRDLAAVLSEDARWDGTALVAEAKVIGPYRDLVTDPVFAEAVGMSIRAAAETTTGEADGRKGVIVTRLVEGQSVDLVTRAGRGGKILAVLESARAEARETLAGETRDMLSRAVGKDAHVVDFDPDDSTVVYRREWEEYNRYRSELLQSTYAVDGNVATVDLTGATPVRQQVTYVPTTTQSSATESGAPTSQESLPAPAGQSTATESQGDNMATTQIEESRLAQLEKDAERVQTLESERDAEKARADKAENALAESRRADQARAIITARATEAGVTFTALEQRGILADLPVTESGDLDQDALTTTVDEAAAEKAAQSGTGSVTGFGGTPTPSNGAVSEADFDARFSPSKEA